MLSLQRRKFTGVVSDGQILLVMFSLDQEVMENKAVDINTGTNLEKHVGTI